jgi:hypothetical protein
MARAPTRVVRKRAQIKTPLKLTLTPAAIEFLERSARDLSATRASFDPTVSRRMAEARRAAHRAYVEEYCARFYEGKKWPHPKPLKSSADIVELAVAGLDEVAAARALCVAIVQATGYRL